MLRRVLSRGASSDLLSMTGLKGVLFAVLKGRSSTLLAPLRAGLRPKEGRLLHLDSTAEVRALMCVLTAELGVCRVEACSLAKESEGWALSSSGADPSPTRRRL